ncbi:MAG TPA: glycosyltransferase family 2 protein [Chloroflexi bacterium]|nr:glycosyltransferase family 2 protein [Chloroflexota bacterium]
MQQPFLSLIIPAYNEEARLPDTLQKAGAFLCEQPYTAEILVVDNNSTDQTAEIILDFSSQYKFIKGLFERNPGKGAAVRCGMQQARGEYLFMCDADLSMPIEEINQFLPPRLEGFQVAIASREAPGSIRYDEPLSRHLGGRLMNWLIQLFILPGLNDTQCGFKCFTRESARDLFGKQTLDGWSFDIELLYMARQRGYKIVEVAIPWIFHQESKVHAVRDALQILLDIRTIRKNHIQGMYDQEN